MVTFSLGNESILENHCDFHVFMLKVVKIKWQNQKVYGQRCTFDVYAAYTITSHSHNVTYQCLGQLYNAITFSTDQYNPPPTSQLLPFNIHTTNTIMYKQLIAHNC